MPRYFFDIDDGVVVRDPIGQDLPSLEVAKREAFRRAGEYANGAGNLRFSSAIVVTVRDGQQTDVLVVRLVCQVERL